LYTLQFHYFHFSLVNYICPDPLKAKSSTNNIFYSSFMGCGASQTSKGSVDVDDLSSHKQPLRTTTITVQEQRPEISATGDTASSVFSPQPKVEFVYWIVNCHSSIPFARYFAFVFVFEYITHPITVNMLYFFPSSLLYSPKWYIVYCGKFLMIKVKVECPILTIDFGFSGFNG